MNIESLSLEIKAELSKLAAAKKYEEIKKLLAVNGLIECEGCFSTSVLKEWIAYWKHYNLI